jgi:hypothetical protein
MKLFKKALRPLIESAKINIINTSALNKMLKRVQHDKKKCVIPNLFRNLEFGNDKELIAFILIKSRYIKCPSTPTKRDGGGRK